MSSLMFMVFLKNSNTQVVVIDDMMFHLPAPSYGGEQTLFKERMACRTDWQYQKLR